MAGKKTAAPKKTNPEPEKSLEAEPVPETEKAIVAVKKTPVKKQFTGENVIRTATLKNEIRRILDEAGYTDVKIQQEYSDKLANKVSVKLIQLLQISRTITSAAKRQGLNDTFLQCTLDVIKMVNASEELSTILSVPELSN